MMGTDGLGRRRLWKLLIIVAAPPALLALGGWFWVDSVCRRRWADMEARTDALVERWERRDISREVLRGEPLDGNAWDDYRLAEAALKGYTPWPSKRQLPGDPTLWEILEGFLNESPKTDLVVVTKALRDLGPSLAHLRRGVRRRNARYFLHWPNVADSSGDVLPSLLGITHVSDLALAQARVSMTDGRLREAMELQLDVARYGQDIAKDGVPLAQMMGYQITRKALDAFHETLIHGHLGKSDLEDAERELEKLERTSPRTDGLVQERIFLGLLLRGADPADLARSTGALTWHHLYSPRLLMAERAEWLDRSADRLEQAESRSWKEVQLEIQLLEKEEELSKCNMYVASRARGVAQSATESRARLRLLLAGIRWMRTGNKLELQDPYGTTLLSRDTDRGLTMWSVGRDALDDGGKGDWTSGPDIVLDLPK